MKLYFREILICALLLLQKSTYTLEQTTTPSQDTNTIYNVIIIGGGPAGLTAGINSGRNKLRPLIIQGETDSQLIKAPAVENWPGTLSIPGYELLGNMKKHALETGATFITDTVTSISTEQRLFTLTTRNNKTLHAHSIIIATGSVPRRLNCPGEQEYEGKGLGSCSSCDGMFYTDKKVAIIGNGNPAIQTALHMTKFTDKILFFHPEETINAVKTHIEQARSSNKITFVPQSTVQEIKGDGQKVTHIIVKNNQTNNIDEIPIDGVFISLGSLPNTDIFKNKLDMTPQGHLITQPNSKETSVAGIFAAGFVADGSCCQILPSSAAGCIAAFEAQKYLNSLNK